MTGQKATTPVLVAAAAVEQKFDEPNAGLEATGLMAQALRRAAEAAAAPALLQQIQRIYVPKGMWAYSDPARLVAEAVGSPEATTVFADIGILQQTLMGDACARIARGEIDVAVVAGGEAKYRQLRAKIAGVACEETTQESPADVVLEPEQEMWLPAESNAGLGMPVGYYAIFASALRAALGDDPDSYRDKVAAMYARFSEIAAGNPHAWKREPVAADRIRNPDAKNPMLAFPYTKLHNTSWNVDQAAALVFTSVAKARELGIPESQWVYPLASTESNHMLPMSQRDSLCELPGARIAGERALECAGVSATDIDLWELYSCFPVAVEIYARELGVPADKDLTVTGGMPFAGGPLNNYVLQATVRMVEMLQARGGGTGMVSSVSGFLTKQAWGIWSTAAPARDFAHVDVRDEVAAAAPPRQVLETYGGEGSIAGYTVLYGGDGPQHAVAVVDTDAGDRCVAINADYDVIAAMETEEFVGRRVRVDGNQFTVA